MNDFLQLQRELKELAEISTFEAAGFSVRAAQLHLSNGNLPAARRVISGIRKVNEATLQHNIDLNIKREQIIASAAWRSS